MTPPPPSGKEPWSLLLSIVDEKSTMEPAIQAKAMSLITRVGTSGCSCFSYCSNTIS